MPLCFPWTGLSRRCSVRCLCLPLPSCFRFPKLNPHTHQAAFPAHRSPYSCPSRPRGMMYRSVCTVQCRTAARGAQGSGAGKRVMSGVSPPPCEATPVPGCQSCRVSLGRGLGRLPGPLGCPLLVVPPPPPPSPRLCATLGSPTCHPPTCLPGTSLITQLPGTSKDGEGDVFVINGGLLLPCPPLPQVAGYSHLPTEARGPLPGPVFCKLGTYI